MSLNFIVGDGTSINQNYWYQLGFESWKVSCLEIPGLFVKGNKYFYMKPGILRYCGAILFYFKMVAMHVRITYVNR